jgi:acetylornithine aminotransferase
MIRAFRQPKRCLFYFYPYRNMSTTPLMNNYGLRNTKIVKGEGAYLIDDQGQRYLDAISGIAVCGLGHCHPAVSSAISEQANTLLHCSNLYLIEPQVELGDALIALSGMEKVFFCNSGAEANEAAIKIARKFGNDKGIASPEIITCDGSFHGRTMATLSATANEKVKAGFTPVLSGFAHAEYGSIEAIRAAGNANTVAVMVEPVQGEGGINVPAPGFLKALRALCDEMGWLLILDEIQTGNGRTGKYFAFEHDGILPDVLTTAKGLGNGFPIGACLARGAAGEVLQPGTHGSTFGGNPLACAVGLAVVREINQSESLQRVIALSDRIVNSLHEHLSGLSGVKEIRSKGLMIGIELDRGCAELVNAAKNKGFLINVTAGNVVRLLPPFILSNDEADSLSQAVADIIQHFLNS